MANDAVDNSFDKVEDRARVTLACRYGPGPVSPKSDTGALAIDVPTFSNDSFPNDILARVFFEKE